METRSLRNVAFEHPAVYVKYNKGLDALLKRTREEYKPPTPVSWRKWQKWLLDIIEGPIHDRRIYWIFDNDGAAGKSFITKWLIGHKGAIMLSGAKIHDAAMAYDGQRVVLFDVPRADNVEWVNYSLIEKIKDGCIFSGEKSHPNPNSTKLKLPGKYMSETKLFAPPHVFVFSNAKPEGGKWTADRCELKTITPADLDPAELREASASAPADGAAGAAGVPEGQFVGGETDLGWDGIPDSMQSTQMSETVSQDLFPPPQAGQVLPPLQGERVLLSER